MNETDFLQRIVLSAEQVEEARLKIPDLLKIFEHHEASKDELLRAGENIQSTLRTVQSVHSTRVRVKTPVSLVRKIVRKHTEDPKRDITLENYRDDVRDLIGLRALHLFKEDWKPIHEGILQIWRLHPKDKKPLAYHRGGDSQELRQQWKDAGCLVKPKDAGYRSIHYIVIDAPNQRDKFCAEIQVRTVFEEAWSEIDHRVRYPDYSEDPLLEEFLLILNRIAGSADEMGSFLLRFQQEKREFELQLQQSEAEQLAKVEAVESIESELEAVKAALKKAVKDQSLSEGERLKLQRALDRVPEIYKRDPIEEWRERQKQDALALNKRLQDFMGNPGGVRFQNLAMLGEKLRRQQEENEKALERLRRVDPKRFGGR